MRGLWLFLGLALVAALIAGCAPAEPAAGSAQRDSAGHYYRGNPDARVVVEEWSDVQCPACARARPVVDRLIQEHGTEIKYVYRHYPLVQIHQQAFAAAEALEAAGAQGKFFEMEEALLKNQRALGPDLYEQQAQALGLDVEEFKAALRDHRYKDRVEADLAQARREGLRGTPTFKVNGQVLFGISSYDDLVAKIQAAARDAR